MMILFAALFVAAIVTNLFVAIKDLKKIEWLGLVLGLAAGIILAVEVCKTPSKNSTNPYFLGTFIALMCMGVAMAVGYIVGEKIKKKKGK